MKVPQLGFLIARERHRIVLGGFKAALHVRQIKAVLLKHFSTVSYTHLTLPTIYSV